jgi:release factor glutamine methyltransferase
MEEVCEVKAYKLMGGEDRLLSAEEVERLAGIEERLLLHEPLGYVLGKVYFQGLWLEVNRRVLIPRPETEELVEKIVVWGTGKAEVDILDVGTGSGCIACALAVWLPGARVRGVDKSAGALATAVANARRVGVEVRFGEADMLEGESMDAALGEESFDMIVSNPPYVRESEKVRMSANVVEYEPGEALYVPDARPLVYYEALVELSRKRLRRGGVLYVEINEALGKETASLVRSGGFKEVELQQDMSGRDRYIQAIR